MKRTKIALIAGGLLFSSVSFISTAQAQIVIKQLCDDGKWYESCTASAGYTNPAPNSSSSSSSSRSASGSSGGAVLGPSNTAYQRTEKYVNTYVPVDPGPIVYKQLCDDGKWYESCTAAAGYTRSAASSSSSANPSNSAGSTSGATVGPTSSTSATQAIVGPSYTTKIGPSGETVYFFKGANGENVTFTQ